MSPLIECTQLTQVYRVGASEVIALQGLDLHVERGEMLGVVGASGSGKSTLMAVLSGLLRPTGGAVRFDGADLGAATARELDTYRRDAIGMVWQDSGRSLLPYVSARDNVALPLRLGGDGSSGARVERLLERVGLGVRGGHRPVELSGGEQQRVALAVALAREPALLLADEPTGALDSETTEEVFALMRSLGEEHGLTQVIVSHDPELARHVDRVVSIRDGRVAAEQRWTTATDVGQAVDEVLVVDSIGRMQLTEDQLELLGDERRVRAEIVDGEIRVRPATAAVREDDDG